jgi:hypothetical protein
MKANDEVDHHLRPVGAATDWRRSRSESSGAVDDLETSYVPAAACLPGPHRRHYVNISNHFVFLFFFFSFSIPHIHLPTSCIIFYHLLTTFIHRFSIDLLRHPDTIFIFPAFLSDISVRYQTTPPLFFTMIFSIYILDNSNKKVGHVYYSAQLKIV